MIIDVKGDGNCLFRCISLALTGSENKHKLYRKLAIRSLSENPQFRAQIYPGLLKQKGIPFKESDDLIETYLKGMKHKFGGQLELQALSIALDVEFRVFGLQNMASSLTFGKSTTDKVVNLKFEKLDGDGHYMLIQKKIKKEKNS